MSTGFPYSGHNRGVSYDLSVAGKPFTSDLPYTLSFLSLFSFSWNELAAALFAGRCQFLFGRGPPAAAGTPAPIIHNSFTGFLSLTYVSYEDIYEYSYSSDYSSYDVSFAGESSLTSAIDYVLSDTLPKLYTLTGHGEDDLSTSFQSAVEQQNIEVADLSLLTEESVPEDADCLLINGPDSDLSQDEVEAIQAYLDTGGDLIVLTDPAQDGQDLTNLEALMGEYGMTANDGVVIEGDTANYALGSPFYLLPNLESHSITSPLQEGGYYILLALAQGITVEESPRDGLTVESLLTTSDAAYSKIAGYSMETYSKEEGDIDGPFSLAAIATDTLEDGSESHVIWVGSTSLLDDQYNQQVSGANQDFFLNCVGWTCEGEEGVSIHAKQITTEYLTMSASTASMLTLLLVAVLPAGYLLFGLRIWIRRKHQWQP